MRRSTYALLTVCHMGVWPASLLACTLQETAELSGKEVSTEVILIVNELPCKNVEKLNQPVKCDSEFFCTHNTYVYT